jgi:phosphoglycolate phosphatase
MIKAVLLDLDETLFLTQGVAFYIENEALRNIGAKQVGPEKHRKLWGGPVLEKLKAYDPTINTAEFNRVWHKVVKKYAASGRLDILTNENRTALLRLKKMRKKLFVVTSRSQMSTEHLLEPTHPLKHLIDYFYHEGNLAYRKPDPRMFDKILAEHKLYTHEVLYVGDTQDDAAAANGANIPCIVTLESGLRSRNDFKTFRVSSFIRNFSELPAAVHKLERVN